MVARKKTRRTSSVSTTGKKLIPTIKKQGLLKGSGMFAAKQTGISGELTNTAVSYGAMLRSRLGR